MPEFNYSCLILDTLPRSIEVSVRGQVQLEYAAAATTMQARGLFGPVTVSYKNIPADGTGFIPVNTYTTFARINMGVRVYERHLSDSIDKYRKTTFDRVPGERATIDRATVDLINAYNRLKNGVLPVAWALHNIRTGFNDLGNSVWLENESGDEVLLKGVPARSPAPNMPTPEVVAQRPFIALSNNPRVSISRLTAPITPSPTPSEHSDWAPTPSPPPPQIPPRLHVATPSAPPLETLYPQLPSYNPYLEPPNYRDVMGESNIIAKTERSKICAIL